MLRITPPDAQALRRTIKLEGKVVGPWVDELKQACEQHSAEADHLHLDLSAVTFIDNAGVNLLRTLLAQGIRVVSCSALVSELLRRESQ